MNFLPLLAETPWNFKLPWKQLNSWTSQSFSVNPMWSKNNQWTSFSVSNQVPLTSTFIQMQIKKSTDSGTTSGTKPFSVSLTGAELLFGVPSSLEWTRHQPTQRDRWSHGECSCRLQFPWSFVTLPNTTWTSPRDQKTNRHLNEHLVVHCPETLCFILSICTPECFCWTFEVSTPYGRSLANQC